MSTQMRAHRAALVRCRACFIWLSTAIHSEHIYLSFCQSKFVFYLVAIYALHNGRNDFVCYSEVLQHWVHCRVCGEVGKQFDILTIKIYIIFNYLLFRACLKHMVVASHKLCCVPSQGESSYSSQSFKVLFIKGIRNSVFILTLFLCGR